MPRKLSSGSSPECLIQLLAKDTEQDAKENDSYFSIPSHIPHFYMTICITGQHNIGVDYFTTVERTAEIKTVICNTCMMKTYIEFN